jgi:hypothetical protein
MLTEVFPVLASACSTRMRWRNENRPKNQFYDDGDKEIGLILALLGSMQLHLVVDTVQLDVVVASA